MQNDGLEVSWIFHGFICLLDEFELHHGFLGTGPIVRRSLHSLELVTMVIVLAGRLNDLTTLAHRGRALFANDVGRSKPHGLGETDFPDIPPDAKGSPPAPVRGSP